MVIGTFYVVVRRLRPAVDLFLIARRSMSLLQLRGTTTAAVPLISEEKRT
jgi:hypothetical protein